MKPDLICNYILKDKLNFDVASEVFRAFPEVRQQIVSSFLARLEERLKKRLKKDWEFKTEGKFFEDSYSGFWFRKTAWKDRDIGFSCWDYGKLMYLAITRDTDNIQHLPLQPRILAEMQKIHPSSKRDNWTEAYVKMRSPASDWSSPEVLWSMRKTAFVTDVAAQLLQIVEATEKELDKIASQERQMTKRNRST